MTVWSRFLRLKLRISASLRSEGGVSKVGERGLQIYYVSVCRCGCVCVCVCEKELGFQSTPHGSEAGKST